MLGGHEAHHGCGGAGRFGEEFGDLFLGGLGDEVAGEGGDGMERGGARADAGALGVREGGAKGEGGGGRGREEMGGNEVDGGAMGDGKEMVERSEIGRAHV